MSQITAAWLREVLVRHDPLEAWTGGAGTGARDYRAEAELATVALRRLQGLGHARTLVADALDRFHPGVYQAVVDGDEELGRRLSGVAWEIWGRHGVVPRPPGPSSADVPLAASTVVPPPAPPATLVEDPVLLTAWLRGIEDSLTDLVSDRTRPESARPFHDALPALLDAYAEASEDQRAATRVSFSRFRLVRYQVSSFATAQYRAIAGPNPHRAARLALTAEALLDGGIDWRDELLLLRDIRQAAVGAGVDFGGPLEEAIRCAGPRSRELLVSLRDGS